MGTQIADLYAKIGADTGEFDKGLGHVQKSMEDTQQKAGGLGSALSGVFSMAGGFLLAQGIGAVTGAVGGLVSGMISGNAEFERYETQFGVLLGSTQAAKDRLAELADFGAKTPFELPEVVRADKILQAFGLHAEDTAKRFGFAGDEIRTIAGDVAAGTGAGFEEISTYLGKFASGATGEAISRMQELGIVTRQQLTEMGLQFSKSGELISPLDKSMGVLLTAMKSKFGGMMDAQSATFEGMMSNLQDWVGQAMRTLGAPIFDALKENLSSLLQFLGSDTVKGAITGIGQGLAQGVSVAVNAVQGLIGVVGDLKGAFDALMSGAEFGDELEMVAEKLNLPPSIVDLWGNIGSAMMEMRNTAQILAPALKAIFDGAEPAEAMMDAVVGLSDSFGPVAAVMSVAQASTSEFGKALLYAANIAGIAVGTFETIRDIVGDTLANAFAAFKSSAQVALAWLPGILDSAMARGQELATIVSSLLVSAFANFGRIANAVFAILPGLVGDVMNVLSVLYDTVGTVLVGAFRILQPIAITVFQVIATAVENLAPKVATLSAAVSDTLATAFGVLRQVAVAVFTAIEPYIPTIQAAIAKLGEVVTTVLGAAFDWLSGFMRDTVIPMLVQLGDWLAANLPGAIDALAGFIGGTLIPALQNVWGFIQQNVLPILSDLFTWLQTNLPAAIATLTDFWNTKLKPALEAVWAFIKDPLVPLIKTLAEIVGTTLKIAVEVLLGVWDKLQPAFKVVADFLAGTLNALLSGLVTTFENLRGPIGWVNDRLNEFKKALEGLSLPDWLVRRSPAPIEQTFMGLADITPQATDTIRAFGAAVGTLDAASINVAAVQSLADAMLMLVTIMGDPRMGVVEPGSNDAARIQGMSDALGRIVSAIKGMVEVVTLINTEVGNTAVRLVVQSRDTLNFFFDQLLQFGRELATRAGLVRTTYSQETIAALQSLGDVLQRLSAIYTATIGIVQTFLDDVNNTRFLNALGSVAARNWIADLVQLIVTWGDQIAAGVAQVELTADTRVTPALGKLGDLLNAVKGVFESTVGVVLTFLDDVNNARFLNALGSVAARNWIVDLTAIIVTWGNQIGDAVDDVQVTINSEVTPKLVELAALLKASTDVLTTTVEAVETLIDIGKKGPPSIDPEGAAQLVIRPLVAIAQGLANEIADAMGSWSQVPPDSAALSKIVQEGVGVLTATVEAVQTLIDLGKTGFPTIDPEGVGDLLIKPLVLIARGLAKQIQDALGAWTPGNLPLKQLSDTVSDMVGVIDGVIDLLTRLAKPDIEFLFYGTPEQTAEKIMLLNGHMIDVLVIVGKALADRIKAAVGAWQSSDLPLSGLSSMVGDMVGVIDGVVDLLARLAKPDIEFLFYGTPQETANKIILLNGHMIDVLVAVAKALAQRIQAALGAVEVEASPALGALSTVLSDFLDLIGNVTELAKELASPPTLPKPSEELDLWIGKAIEWARGVATAAQEAAYGYALLAEYGLADLATAISDALDVLTTVADLVEYFADPPALPKPSEALDLWIADAVIWARGVGTAAQEAAYGYRVLADEGLKELADALGDTLSVIRDTLDIVKLTSKLDTFDPAKLGMLRDKLLAALPVIVQIARDFAAQASASGITAAWSEAAQVLADTMGSAVGAIRDALDLSGLLNDPDTRIPTPAQISGKIAAVLDVVDVAVAAFGARASAAAASGMDLAGLTAYASAVKGVFEAIGEVAQAVKDFTGIYTGPGIGQNSGFANIKATLDQIFALFEDAAKHADLVTSVTSVIGTALAGITALAFTEGGNAGNAWLRGFQGAFAGGMAMPTATPGGTPTGGGQVTINNVTNNTKTVNVSVNASTAEASRAGVTGIYSLVMY